MNYKNENILMDIQDGNPLHNKYINRLRKELNERHYDLFFSLRHFFKCPLCRKIFVHNLIAKIKGILKQPKTKHRDR